MPRHPQGPKRPIDQTSANHPRTLVPLLSVPSTAETLPQLRPSGIFMYRAAVQFARRISFSSRHLFSRSAIMSSQPHVGIIGAGFAGLRCADILIKNGARVTILEARDRIGGRVSCFSIFLVDIVGNEYRACIGAVG